MVSNLDARQALEHVAASQTFREAENVQRLLLYLGEAGLNGRAEHLKEYSIGVDVLGRPPEYEPRVDSSARMLASRLRRKLEDYYRGEGAADPVRIGFPKGGYKLTFAAAGVSPAPSGDVRRWKWIAGGSAALAVALAVYTAVAPPVSAPGLPPELEAFWQPVLDRRVPVVVSYGSPLFVQVSGWLVRRHDLNDWSQAANDLELKKLREAVGGGTKPYYGYAGTGDVSGAFLVGRLLGAHTGQLVLKRGAVLSWEDIQNNHLVFIGNGKNQERIRYILDHLDFTLDGTDHDSHHAQARMIRRYIAWRNRHADDANLRELVNRANVA